MYKWFLSATIRLYRRFRTSKVVLISMAIVLDV